MAVPTTNPDYVNYSLEQLERARRSIDVERFPERTHLLDVLIADRMRRQSDQTQPLPSHATTTGEIPNKGIQPVTRAQMLPPVTLPRLSPAGNLWLRRLLACLTIWGGIAGAMACLVALFSSSGFFGAIITGGLVVLFIWSVWGGVLLLEGQPNALHLNQLVWALQVPVLATPWLQYIFASGGYVPIWVRFDVFQFGVNFVLGSQAQLYFNSQSEPMTVGVNLFALAVIGLLVALEDSVHADEPALSANQSNVDQTDEAKVDESNTGKDALRQ